MIQQNSQPVKPHLHYTRSIPLKHKGECQFAGISTEDVVYVDELHGEDDWMAQYAFQLDGTLIGFHDESNSDFGKLWLNPQPITRPTRLPSPHPLHFGGARLRGMRQEDRIQDIVHPLTIAEKMALSSRLHLTAPLIGLAESHVLAAAQLEGTPFSMVCRRLRVAYVLPEIRLDDHHLPYDYDTITLYIAHWYADDEVDLSVAFQTFGDRQMQNPMDCMIWKQWLLIAEGGTDQQTSAIHLWQLGTD